MFTSTVVFSKLQYLNGKSAYLKGHLSNCHRGSEVQSISKKRLRSMQEARKLRKDSLCSNLRSFNQDNLVAHKNCLSTYSSKTRIDRRLKRELSSRRCSRDLLSPMRQRR